MNLLEENMSGKTHENRWKPNLTDNWIQLVVVDVKGEGDLTKSLNGRSHRNLRETVDNSGHVARLTGGEQRDHPR